MVLPQEVEALADARVLERLLALEQGVERQGRRAGGHLLAAGGLAAAYSLQIVGEDVDNLQIYTQADDVVGRLEAELVAIPDPEELSRESGLDDVTNPTTRALRRGCREITDHLRGSLGTKTDANAAGEAAWLAYTQLRDATLTPIQQLQIASLGGGTLGALCR